MYRRFFKRLIDIVFSALGLIILSPLFLFIIIAIKVEDPGPVFFTQKRFGIHRSFFNIVKFRSMRMDAPHDVPTHLMLTPQKWITKVGAFLRKTSLDELPQIAQVLTGKMSIVGPRPALWNQLDLMEARDRYGANDVTPGLTGWAQVNGRDIIDIDLKAKLDGEYAKNISFLYDLKIFFRTFDKVLRHLDVVEGGPAQAGTPEQTKENRPDA